MFHCVREFCVVGSRSRGSLKDETDNGGSSFICPANSTTYGDIMKYSPVPYTGHAHSGTCFKTVQTQNTSDLKSGFTRYTEYNSVLQIV